MICSVDSFNSRYWKDIASSAKDEPKGVKADTMCIAYRSEANTNKMMGMKHETMGNHSRRGSYLLNITYYKLQTRKHFAYYIVGQSIESYRVGGVHKIFNQVLMFPRVHCVWKTMRKKPKIIARMGLCSSQCHGGTMTNAMKSHLSETVWDVMQANHQNGAPSIDKSHRMICG